MLAGAGLVCRPELEVAGDFEVEGGRAAAERLLSLPMPPTAIFAFNDNLAAGACRAARERGLVLPRDLSIVGFDDAEHAALLTPALTTIRQPLREMARLAIDLLGRVLSDRPLEALRVELGTQLVVRDSTARPPAADVAATHAAHAQSGGPRISVAADVPARGESQTVVDLAAEPMPRSPQGARTGEEDR
jgi:DNA-binding LacI/PurR family transcriptional regulator